MMSRPAASADRFKRGSMLREDHRGGAGQGEGSGRCACRARRGLSQSAITTRRSRPQLCRRGRPENIRIVNAGWTYERKGEDDQAMATTTLRCRSSRTSRSPITTAARFSCARGRCKARWTISTPRSNTRPLCISHHAKSRARACLNKSSTRRCGFRRGHQDRCNARSPSAALRGLHRYGPVRRRHCDCNSVINKVPNAQYAMGRRAEAYRARAISMLPLKDLNAVLAPSIHQRARAHGSRQTVRAAGDSRRRAPTIAPRRLR